MNFKNVRESFADNFERARGVGYETKVDNRVNLRIAIINLIQNLKLNQMSWKIRKD